MHDGVSKQFKLFLGELRRLLTLLARGCRSDHGALLFIIRLVDGLWHRIFFAEFFDVCLGCSIIGGLEGVLLLLDVGLDLLFGLFGLIPGSPDLVVEGVEAPFVCFEVASFGFIPEWLGFLQEVNHGGANSHDVLWVLFRHSILCKVRKHSGMRFSILSGVR